MKRIIKYRMWDKKLNIMWEPIALEKLLQYLIFQSCPNADAYVALKDHFEDIVWLQYTGEKDRKGNEVYEGDILRYNTFPHRNPPDQLYEVYFSDTGAWYLRLIEDALIQDPNHIETIDRLNGEYLYYSEVTSNIYENPILPREEE